MITAGAVRCNWAKHQRVFAHRLGTHAVQYTQIPGVLVCCWNSPNIPAGTIPVALFVFQRYLPAKLLKTSPLNSAKCDSHHWILHRPIKGSSSRVAHAQTPLNTFHVRERVFHPEILFICPVTHATLDHNTHYAPLDIILRLFQTLCCELIEHEKRHYLQKLCRYQLSDAAHGLAFLFQCPSAV